MQIAPWQRTQCSAHSYLKWLWAEKYNKEHLTTVVLLPFIIQWLNKEVVDFFITRIKVSIWIIFGPWSHYTGPANIPVIIQYFQKRGISPAVETVSLLQVKPSHTNPSAKNGTMTYYCLPHMLHESAFVGVQDVVQGLFLFFCSNIVTVSLQYSGRQVVWLLSSVEVDYHSNGGANGIQRAIHFITLFLRWSSRPVNSWWNIFKVMYG